MMKKGNKLHRRLRWSRDVISIILSSLPGEVLNIAAKVSYPEVKLSSFFSPFPQVIVLRTKYHREICALKSFWLETQTFLLHIVSSTIEITTQLQSLPTCNYQFLRTMKSINCPETPKSQILISPALFTRIHLAFTSECIIACLSCKNVS